MPERPKKPLSPYFRYMTEIRPSIAAANPQLRLTDVIKLIGTKWSTVDKSQKEALQEAYKRDQIAYLKSRASYEASLTEDQRFQLTDLKQKLVDQKTKIAERKRVRDLGRPKRPMSPYLCWLSADGQHIRRTADESFHQWQKRRSTAWKELSDAAKKPFYDQSQNAYLSYSDELLAWEEKMVRHGNVELVRSSMLLSPVEKKLNAKKTGGKATAADSFADDEPQRQK